MALASAFRLKNFERLAFWVSTKRLRKASRSMQWLRLPRRLRRVPQDPGESRTGTLPMGKKLASIFMMSFTGEVNCCWGIGLFSVYRGLYCSLGIVMNHCKDPYSSNMESRRVFFVAQLMLNSGGLWLIGRYWWQVVSDVKDPAAKTQGVYRMNFGGNLLTSKDKKQHSRPNSNTSSKEVLGSSFFCSTRRNTSFSSKRIGPFNILPFLDIKCKSHFLHGMTKIVRHVHKHLLRVQFCFQCHLKEHRRIRIGEDILKILVRWRQGFGTERQTPWQQAPYENKTLEGFHQEVLIKSVTKVRCGRPLPSHLSQL